MRISIITINYNGSEKTIKLLKSLNNQNDKYFEIVVVDNASSQTDFQKIDEWVKSNRVTVNIQRNEQNLGFSGGCNTGIEMAVKNGADWLVLLNNDTWVEKDFISVLGANLGPKNGVVGLPIDEGVDKMIYGGRIQWLKTTLSHSQDLNNVQYAVGGAMCIHKSVIDKIGKFDENFFLYFEDVDFSVRSRKAQVPITFISMPLVYHLGSASTKLLGAPKLLRYHYRNALYFNKKNGPAWVKILIWPWSWIIMAKQIFKIMLGINREQSKSILVGVIDFYKGNMGIIND